jgi:hypothetical protein
MRFALISFLILLCISSKGWAQKMSLARKTSAIKLQACFQSQVNEHSKAIKQFEEQFGKNYKNSEESDEEQEIKNEVNSMISNSYLKTTCIFNYNKIKLNSTLQHNNN